MKVGETVTVKCYYKMKTINVCDITSADAAYWGSGNFTFRVQTAILYSLDEIELNKTITKRLPKFTYEDIQKWQKIMRSTAQKIWNGDMTVSWTPTMEHNGKQFVVLAGVSPNGFEETSGGNNDTLSVGPSIGIVVKLSVSPETMRK